MNNENEIKIDDTILAATLISLENEVLRMDRTSQRIGFIFERTPLLEAQVKAYQDGSLLVKPRIFSEAHKRAKALLYDPLK